MHSKRILLGVAVGVLLAGGVWGAMAIMGRMESIGRQMAYLHRPASRAIPVSDFVPNNWSSPTIAVWLGSVSIDVPRREIKEVRALASSIPGLELVLEGMTIHLLPPTRSGGATHLCRSQVKHQPSELVEDEVALLAAAYALDERDLIRQHTADAKERLEELQRIKFIVCAEVDSVEVVRLPDVKGLLLTRNDCDNNMAFASFEYWSHDEQVRGVVRAFRGDYKADAFRERARMLVSSVKLTETTSSHNPEVDLAGDVQRAVDEVRNELGRETVMTGKDGDKPKR